MDIHFFYESNFYYIHNKMLMLIIIFLYFLIYISALVYFAYNIYLFSKLRSRLSKCFGFILNSLIGEYLIWILL